MSVAKATTSGTCTWTYHATPTPGYWTVVDNCPSGKSCASKLTTTQALKVTTSGKTKTAPHPEFLPAVINKYMETQKTRQLTATEQKQYNEAVRLKSLAVIPNQQTYEMDCV